MLPTLHSARNNLIRGLLKRATPASFAAALAHAEASAELQPDAAEMRYQLGVVRMHCNDLDAAADAYEGTLEIDASHVGALVNGAHVLAQLAADGDACQRARLLRVARLGVAAGLWAHELQRPPHRLPELCPGRPWHDKRAFGFVALLEAAAPQIRAELLALRGGGAASAAAAPFSAVGGRAAHDASLVAAGAWREYPFLGGGMRHNAHCARCPVTASVLERIPEAVGCAMSGGSGVRDERLDARLTVANAAPRRAKGEVFDDSFEQIQERRPRRTPHQLLERPTSDRHDQRGAQARRGQEDSYLERVGSATRATAYAALRSVGALGSKASYDPRRARQTRGQGECGAVGAGDPRRPTEAKAEAAAKPAGLRE